MKIERIELKEIRLPLIAPFETSFGRTSERRILLTRVYEASGIVGYGECTAAESPFYNHETIDSAWHIIRDVIAPMLLGKQLASAADVGPSLRRIRGNNMAKAAIETACWELEARSQGAPLYKLLGGIREEIACGVSIGIQENISALLKKIEAEIASGYQRVKIKIKPGWDMEVIKAVRAHFPDIPLMVDANSAYSLNDIELFKRMDQFNLMMIEQPLSYSDIIDHSKLQSQINTPICLDESILNSDDARKAIEIGACRIINIKLGRVGGHAEVKRLQEFCQSHNVPVWCGGMLEAGVGRAHNIAISTLPGFTLPGDVSASKRYWEEDIIIPPVEVTPRGTIAVRQGVGIGYEINEKRIEALTVRRDLYKIN